MEKALEKMCNEGKVLNWYNLSKLMTNEAANVAGRMPKRRGSPGHKGHEEEAQEEHKRITEISSELFSLIEASKWCLMVEEKEQKILSINEERSRKTCRKKLRGWERRWWKQIICQCQKAEKEMDLGRMYLYQLLKKLGMRDSKTASARDYFTPQEYKLHFEKVSKDRNEESEETRQKAIERIVDMKDSEVAKKEADKLNSSITRDEILRESSKVNDGAPGLYNVRITYVRQASTTTQKAICNVLLEMTNKHPSEWETLVNTGLVVPLFKKGQRDNINNYRGVCLLSMASRILARVMASRLRILAEAVGVLDENQDGFQIGRSTDAAQICVRLHEDRAICQCKQYYRTLDTFGNTFGY